MKKLVLFIITSLLFTFLCLSVSNTYSLFTKKIDKTGSISTIKSEATFIEGRQFNAKIKSLAGNNDATYLTEDNFILNVSKSDTLKINPTSDNIVSTNDSLMPIYAWFSNGTLYYYSEANNIYLNEDSSYMFYKIYSLSNISGLSSFNSSKVVNFSRFLAMCPNVSDISALSNYNTSNVEIMDRMFYLDENTHEIYNLGKITDLSPLSSWDTKKVTTMNQIFKFQSLTSNDGIKNWDTRSLTDIYLMFYGNAYLETLDLSNYDFSKITDSSNMLTNTNSLREVKTPRVYPDDTTQKIGLPKTMYDENMVAYTTLGKSTTPTSPTQTWLKEGYTVTLNPDGGTVSPSTITVRKDGTYDSLPTPTKTGYTFLGWNGKNMVDLQTGITIVQQNVSIVDNKIIFDGSTRENNPISQVRIQKFHNSTSHTDSGNLCAVTPSINRYSCTFTKTSDFDTIAIRANTPLYDPLISFNVNLENNKKYTLSYDVDYYNRDESKVILKNIQLEESETATTYEQFIVTSSTDVTQEKNHTLKAIWEANTYTVTFDYDGATGGNSTATKSVIYDSTYGTLPEPTKTGYKFLGWNGKNIYDFGTYDDYYHPYAITVDTTEQSISATKTVSWAGDYWKNNKNNYLPGTYTVSAEFTGDTGSRHIIFAYDQNNNIINNTNLSISGLEWNNYYNGWLASGTKTKTFTIPNTVSYWRYGSAFSGDANTTGKISNIQIEEGSTATPYEPYYITSSTKVVRTSNHTLKAIWEKIESTFDTGEVVNQKMKKLAGYSEATYDSRDANITTITRSNTLPSAWIGQNDVVTPPSENNVISSSTSNYPIYAWYDNGTIYYYTEDLDPQMNSNANYIFNKLTSLTSLNVNTIDTSSTTSVDYMFNNCESLTSLDLSTFNLSNVTSSTSMLDNMTALDKLKTPKNKPSDNTVIINLPATFFDTNDNSYTTINSASTNTWLGMKYTISYNLNGGTMNSAKTFYIPSDTYTLPIPTKEGYSFDGWTGSNGVNPQVNVTISNTTGNKSYAAAWTQALDGALRKYSESDTNISYSYDSQTKIYTITQKAGSSGWGVGVICDGANTRIPWGYTYIMQFDVYIPRAKQLRLDTNAAYDDGTGNDEYGTSKFYINGSSAGGNTALTAGEWVHAALYMTNNNETRNPNHRDLYSYSAFGFLLTNDTEDLTYQVKNLTVSTVDLR